MDGEVQVQSEFCLERICRLKALGMLALRAVKLLFLLIVTLRPNPELAFQMAGVQYERLTAVLDRHGSNTSYAGASSDVRRENDRGACSALVRCGQKLVFR